MNFDTISAMDSPNLVKTVCKLWWGKTFEANELRLIEAMMVGSIFHQGAPSCVHGQEVAELGGNLELSLIGGLATIGPIHGRATSICAQMLQDDNRSVKELVSDYLAHNRTIPGLGHRVYKREDPRVTQLVTFAETIRPSWPFWQRLSEIARELELQKIALPINIDGAIAALLSDLEIPWEKTGIVFVWPRMAGLAASYFEQTKHAMPIRLKQT